MTQKLTRWYGLAEAELIRVNQHALLTFERKRQHGHPMIRGDLARLTMTRFEYRNKPHHNLKLLNQGSGDRQMALMDRVKSSAKNHFWLGLPHCLI
jgi:hypothetical protein